MACAVCFRCERGFAFVPRLAGESGKTVYFCAMEHLNLWRTKNMDWTAKEDEMLLASGKAGGEYLESINTTDLAKLNKDQWLAFLRCVIGRMAEERASVELNDEIPF